MITLNNYIPFQKGSPQYIWAMDAFASVDRTKTPWLFVQFHSPPYHTYVTHYKEMVSDRRASGVEVECELARGMRACWQWLGNF